MNFKAHTIIKILFYEIVVHLKKHFPSLTSYLNEQRDYHLNNLGKEEAFNITHLYTKKSQEMPKARKKSFKIFKICKSPKD